MTKLNELLACLNNGHVIVQTHNYPDQDALASAMGLKVLLEAKGKKVTIGYEGIIDKENTLKMMELLGIECYESSQLTLAPEDEIIIVDGQKGNINMTDLVGDEVACIDHHKIRRGEKYKFSDIRENVGACASIIGSYFFENGIKPSRQVATALLYGIRMDTHNMTRGVSKLDLAMFSRLFPMADHGHIKLLENFCLKLSDLEAYRTAIDTLHVVEGVGVAAVGAGCSEALIASVSDFLLTLSSVQVTLVYSYRAGGVKFSVRSEVECYDASDMIVEALKGLGDGGGHADMAAGFIPNVPDEQMARDYAAVVEGRFLERVHR
ncbi:MAG: DHH family phosphoesterase [Lachnospiraceae bacterium]|nr:DHH family phosphoesterase [Lachnospiraceae bacterium]